MPGLVGVGSAEASTTTESIDRGSIFRGKGCVDAADAIGSSECRQASCIEGRARYKVERKGKDGSK